VKVPSIAPFHVDGIRMGGSVASHRHGFGNAVLLPRKPQVLEAPPKRSLGQGTPQAPQLSQSQIEAIRADAAPIIEALQLEMEATKVEADWVSGPTLRVQPDQYKSIAIIGPYFTPQEIRSQILIDASEIENAASRMLTGALGSYLAPEQVSLLQTVVKDSKSLRAYVQQFDLAPITGAKTRLSEEHLEGRVLSITESIKDAERGIVTHEAGSVPVIEPMEKGLGIGGLLALGALVVVGVIIADLV
jgi:hypothetical protein